MAEDEEFSLWVGTEELRLRTIVHSPREPRPSEQSLIDRVAVLLRTGLEWREPSVVSLAESLMRSLGPRPPLFEAASLMGGERPLEEVARMLIADLWEGRISVTLRATPALRERDELPQLPLDPAPGEKPEDGTTSFEIRFVDEIGNAISGVAVELDTSDGEAHDLTTNAAGIALLDSSKAAGATASVKDVRELDDVLSERWIKPRQGSPPRESNTTELTFEGAPIGPVPVKAAVPNTVVLTPPLGRVHLQLFDKTGRVRHAERDYTITGPEDLSGTTDESGFLRHDDVFPGDYTLTLKLEFFEGKDAQIDEYESPLVVIPGEQGGNQIRAIGAVPYSVLAKLRFFFNTNKAFLLPTPLPGIRKLRSLYAENNPSKLLVVGHADTTAGASVNDPLSLDRARATIAFLKDDVDAWLEFYDKPASDRQRWGRPEDRMMLLSIPDFASKPKGEDAVRWFQRTRGLTVDGVTGPQTRRQLITEYMALDGVSLADEGIEIEATAHGCGENFPLGADGEKLDPAPKDEQRDPKDRRVELFFFDPEFGIAPAPASENSAAGSAEYPAWRKSVIQTVVLDPSDTDALRATFVELSDAHFRTNSAVVLPEGEDPSAKGEHASLTSVSGIAMLLRFNEERPGKKVFVAGHTDTAGKEGFNQELSTERAKCALALLVGDRSSFQAICDKRHITSDIKQILSWVSLAFGFDCAPGAIDDNATTAVAPVKRFQTAYNANRLGLEIAQPQIAVDGIVGPETWGAFFDCYEVALQRELAEDAAGVAELRAQLAFVDDDRKALGFGELFPIEELGADNYRSQQNRRVELLTFDSGEEPDLVHAEQDPETSELYLPGQYERLPLPLRPGGAKPHMSLTLLLFRPERTRSGVAYELVNDDGTYSQKLTEPASTREETLQLDFTDVPMGSPLTLRQLSGSGTIDFVFKVPPATALESAPLRTFVKRLEPKTESSTGFLSYDLDGALV